MLPGPDDGGMLAPNEEIQTAGDIDKLEPSLSKWKLENAEDGISYVDRGCIECECSVDSLTLQCSYQS